MDCTVAAGGEVSRALESVFAAACLRTAAASNGTMLSPDAVAAMFGSIGASHQAKKHRPQDLP